MRQLPAEGLMPRGAATTQSVPATSPTAARLSFAATGAFMVLLASLHVLKPEIDPAWRFISEYALRDYGWMMVLAFLSFAVAYVALFIAIRSHIRTVAGRIGLVMLLTSAAGLTIAALFTTDPITTSHDAMTTQGKLHSLGGTLGMAMPIAAVLVSWALSRNPAWSSARPVSLWAGGVSLVAFVVSVTALGVMLSESNGTFGPDVMVGWPTRFEVLAYCGWMMTVTWHATRVPGQRT